jgi:hypothetical protein
MLGLQNRKWMPLSIGFWLVLILAFLFRPLFLLVLLLMVPYGILSVYNYVRLIASDSAYISEGAGIRASFARSWKLTEGKALKTFGIYALVGLVWGIGMSIMNFIFQMLWQLFIAVGQMGGSGALILSMVIIAIFFAAYYALSIPLQTLASYYLLIGIYEKLLADEKTGGLAVKASGGTAMKTNGTAPARRAAPKSASKK